MEKKVLTWSRETELDHHRMPIKIFALQVVQMPFIMNGQDFSINVLEFMTDAKLCHAGCLDNATQSEIDNKKIKKTSLATPCDRYKYEYVTILVLQSGTWYIAHVIMLLTNTQY